MANTKNLLFDEVQSLCELDNNEQIFIYLFDYFSTNELAGFIEHIKEEKNNPGYDPEDCECKETMEADGIEYTQDFTASDDGTYWICDHCGRHQ